MRSTILFLIFFTLILAGAAFANYHTETPDGVNILIWDDDGNSLNMTMNEINDGLIQNPNLDGHMIKAAAEQTLNAWKKQHNQGYILKK